MSDPTDDQLTEDTLRIHAAAVKAGKTWSAADMMAPLDDLIEWACDGWGDEDGPEELLKLVWACLVGATLEAMSDPSR